MARHTIQELHQYQALTLEQKIEMTKERIKAWVDHYGIDGVYVSFSSGKDSTVLLHIARQLYPTIKAVFVDVPTQYPELREYAKNWGGQATDIIKPQISFMEVCEKYGFPLISKEVSQVIYESKEFLRKGKPIPKYRLDRLNGTATDSNGNKSQYNIEKWKFLLDAPFDISHKCCAIMKKNPVKKYEKETGRKPIIGQMASESKMRAQEWLKYGCNAFDVKRPVSNPMMAWTDQDVLAYVVENNIKLCSIYGDVVVDYAATGQVEGQQSLSEYGIFDKERPCFKCTGRSRSGCTLCGFGAMNYGCNGDFRFEKMKQTHPGMYRLLDVVKNNGVTYREAIKWVNEHNGKGEIIRL